MLHETHILTTSQDVVRIRQIVRAHMVALNFSLVNQTKVVTAASELARNMVQYGGGGSVLIDSYEFQGRYGLRLTFEDNGPGIPDITLAMTDGYTSSGGLGLGLGGSKRLMDEFDIWSEPGSGTRVTVIKWR